MCAWELLVSIPQTKPLEPGLPRSGAEPAWTGGLVTTAIEASPQGRGDVVGSELGSLEASGLDFRNGTNIYWALTACPGVRWALSQHVTWSSGSSWRGRILWAPEEPQASPRRGEGLCRSPSRRDPLQPLGVGAGKYPESRRQLGPSRDFVRTPDVWGHTGAGRASASPPLPHPASSSSSWAGFPEPAGAWRRSGWPCGSLEQRLHSDPGVSVRLSIRLSAQPWPLWPPRHGSCCCSCCCCCRLRVVSLWGWGSLSRPGTGPATSAPDLNRAQALPSPQCLHPGTPTPNKSEAVSKPPGLTSSPPSPPSTPPCLN